MIALSKRSAICPPRPDRKKNGPMNTAAVSVISTARFSTPGANRIRNTSAFSRKLSLNAEKNWHQNKGAKRRDVIRWSDIGDSSRGANVAVRFQSVVPGDRSRRRREGRPGTHNRERLQLIEGGPRVSCAARSCPG